MQHKYRDWFSSAARNSRTGVQERPILNLCKEGWLPHGLWPHNSISHSIYKITWIGRRCCDHKRKGCRREMAPDVGVCSDLNLNESVTDIQQRLDPIANARKNEFLSTHGNGLCIPGRWIRLTVSMKLQACAKEWLADSCMFSRCSRPCQASIFNEFQS